MAETKDYDLGLFGDISSKWLVYLTTVGCFAAFAEKIMNGIQNFLPVKLVTSFNLFVFLYFISITIYIIFQLNRNTLFGKSNGIKLNIRKWVPFALIMAIFAYWYLVNDEKIVNSLAWVTIIFMCITAIVCFTMEFRNKKLTSARTEFAILITIAIILFSSFFITSRHIGKGSRTDKSVFTLFENRKKLKDSLMSVTTDLLDSAVLKNNAFEEKVAYKRIFLSKKLQKENKFQTNYWDSSLIEHSGKFKEYCDSLFNSRGQPKPIAGDLYKLDSIFRYCNSYADRIIKETPKIEFVKEFDTAMFVQQSFRFTNYLFITQTMGFKAQESETQYDQVLKQQWSSHIRLVQYKGLYFFSVLLFVLYILLYLHRLQIDKLLGEENQQSVESQGQPTSRYLTKGIMIISNQMSRIMSIIFIRIGNIPASLETKTANQSKAQIDALLASGNQIKNFIFAITLLMIPYFQTFTEKSISLDKPFLDFSLSDLLTPFKQADGLNTSGDNYNKLTAQINARQEIVNKIYGDTNTLVLSDRIYYPVPITNIDKVGPEYKDSSIKEILKELGKNTIEDPADRTQFILYVENVKK